jgi:vacuolar-type H+-ATPase subunit I/STV1
MHISKELFDLADQLKLLRDEKKDLEQQVKDVNAMIERVDFELATAMAESETQNFTRNGTQFCLANKTMASAAANRKEELFEALREEGFGGLIYETVNANSLSAFVKEQIAENEDVLPNWLNGLVNVFEKTTVSVRKTQSK